MEQLQRLVDIISTLRGDGGCPWDREQTWSSMRPYLMEETYEVLDAIDASHDDVANATELKKELGDLLFVLLLMAQIGADRQAFSIDDIARSVADKMVRRHPHVFDPAYQAPTGDQPGSIAAWEARKSKEKTKEASILDGVPHSMPGLLRAHRIGEKVAGLGFDWSSLQGVRTKVDEELAELDEAITGGDAVRISEELGDVLLTLASLGRHLQTPAEDALRTSTHIFQRRFQWVEAAVQSSGKPWAAFDEDQLDALWNQAKTQLRGEPSSGD